jgi:hypothetical protein
MQHHGISKINLYCVSKRFIFRHALYQVLNLKVFLIFPYMFSFLFVSVSLPFVNRKFLLKTLAYQSVFLYSSTRNIRKLFRQVQE